MTYGIALDGEMIFEIVLWLVIPFLFTEFADSFMNVLEDHWEVDRRRSRFRALAWTFMAAFLAYLYTLNSIGG